MALEARCIAALRATPPDPAPVAGGWQMVPVEPTNAMLRAADAEENRLAILNYGCAPAAEVVWSTMLSAAPSPPPRASDADVTALVEAVREKLAAEDAIDETLKANIEPALGQEPFLDATDRSAEASDALRAALSRIPGGEASS